MLFFIDLLLSLRIAIHEASNNDDTEPSINAETKLDPHVIYRHHESKTLTGCKYRNKGCASFCIYTKPALLSIPTLFSQHPNDTLSDKNNASFS